MTPTQCREHGRTSSTFVSPAVRAAFEAARSDAAGEICRVRYVFEDHDYPSASMWLDRDFAREASLAPDAPPRLLELDESWLEPLRLVCSRCLETWLRQQGIDTALSAEEKDFVRLRDALRAELTPSLGAFLMPSPHAANRSGRKTLPPGSMAWCSARRSCPFDAGMRRLTGDLRASCTQDGDTLRCASSVEPIGAPAIEGPPVVVSAALDEAARRELRAWAQEVLAFFATHAPALGLV